MVRSGKILVYDLDPVSGVASLLRGILESQPLLRIRVDLKGRVGSEEDHLLSVIWNFHPDIVFFVLAPLLGGTKELLKAATKARRAPPVIAVVAEEEEPEDILRAVRGAADLDYRLEPHGRYSHTTAYVQRLLAAACLRSEITYTELRMESGAPVAGFLIRAAKPFTARP